MTMLGRLKKLLHTLLRKDLVEQQMSEEMRFHLDMETEDLISAGISPDVARRAATLKFGGVERFKEEARFARGGRVVEDFFRDIKLALRGLRRSPGFAAVALGMLALGIGANTAIFSVIHAVLIKPLPFNEPGKLVQVYETHLAQGWTQFSFSQMNLLDLMESSTSFEGIAGTSGSTMNLTGDGPPERVVVRTVTPGFYDILGVTPVLGRTFRDSDVAGVEPQPVLLLGENAWTSRFGADPTIIGRTIQLDGMAYEVVGILPSDGPWIRNEFYMPMGLNPESQRDNHFIQVIARLRDDATLEVARAELSPMADRLTQQNAPVDDGMGFRVDPSNTWAASDDLRRSLWVFMGAVGFLMLIACMNLANLLLARVAHRRQQVAMCITLGASRTRVVRQLLTESAVLGLAGAVLGIGVAKLGLNGLVALDPGNIPQLGAVEINGVVLIFTLVVAVATGVLGGLVPAFKMPSENLSAGLRDGMRGSGTRSQARVRAWLVGAETALSLVLLVGAGLLIRSLVAVYGVDPGLDPEGRLTFEVNLPSSYSGEEAHAFRQEFLGRIRGLSPVQTAAAVNMRPLGGGNVVMSVIPEGETIESFGGAVSADWRMITEDYFQSIGLALIQGRDLTHEMPDADGDEEPGFTLDVVVSQSLAGAVWPGEDAVGKQAQLWVTPDQIGNVVGVVEDMRERGPGLDERMAIYFTYAGAGWSPAHFVVHAKGEPRAVLPTIRDLLNEMNPNLPLSRVLTMDEMMQNSTASRRFTMTLLGVFAGVALVLALAGLYGVIADSVSQRAQELGVRVALGASSNEVVSLVVKQGMRPAVLGIVVGLVAAVAMSRLLQSLLFGVAPTDVATYLVMGGILALAALAACWIPALAVLKLDPVTVLKEG